MSKKTKKTAAQKMFEKRVTPKEAKAYCPEVTPEDRVTGVLSSLGELPPVMRGKVLESLLANTLDGTAQSALFDSLRRTLNAQTRLPGEFDTRTVTVGLRPAAGLAPGQQRELCLHAKALVEAAIASGALSDAFGMEADNPWTFFTYARQVLSAIHAQRYAASKLESANNPSKAAELIRSLVVGNIRVLQVSLANYQEHLEQHAAKLEAAETVQARLAASYSHVEVSLAGGPENVASTVPKVPMTETSSPTKTKKAKVTP
jgi:hypothetical protein